MINLSVTLTLHMKSEPIMLNSLDVSACEEIESNAGIIGLPLGLDPGPIRGICQGIQEDGLASLPLGRGKFARWIYQGDFLLRST